MKSFKGLIHDLETRKVYPEFALGMLAQEGFQPSLDYVTGKGWVLTVKGFDGDTAQQTIREAIISTLKGIEL